VYTPRIVISSKGCPYYERTLVSDTDIAHLRSQHGDNEHVVALMIVGWVSLLGDSPIGDDKPGFVIERFLQQLLKDYRGTIVTYSNLAHQLLKGLVRDDDGNIIVPYLAEFQKLPIYREYLAFVRTRDPRVLRYILSFLLFSKKGHYEDSALKSDALRKWLEVEDRLVQLKLPPWVANLRRILDVCFRSWAFEDFLPKHGNGAVADRGVRGVVAKNTAFSVDKRISYLYLRENNIFLNHDIQLYPTPDGGVADNQRSLDIARLMFVPKDHKSSRSICMEPIGFMWAQQGVRRVYERWLSESLLGDHVFLREQERNQQASAYGSASGEVDTIDLSSASDCVSWDLVKQIFPPKVLKHLAATRTSKVELPDGTIRYVRKYAPMGSALCFPVQSTIYAAIALMVGICRFYGVDWSVPGCLDGLDITKMHGNAFSRSLGHSGPRFSHYLCYGDDIIVDSRITEDVITALTALGFQVNVSKSFVGQEAFRESCGEYHFDGKSVSPFFLKTKSVSSRVNIVSLAGLIDLANRALSFGYLNLRRHLVQFILHYPIEGVKGDSTKNPILFTGDENESCAVLCTSPRNTHLRRRRFDPRLAALVNDGPGVTLGGQPLSGTDILYQRDEFESIVPGPRRQRRISEEFDNYRYVMWWRTRAYGAETDPMDSVPMTHDVLEVDVCRRWTAC
jgi:hypothetical protein